MSRLRWLWTVLLVGAMAVAGLVTAPQSSAGTRPAGVHPAESVTPKASTAAGAAAGDLTTAFVPVTPTRIVDTRYGTGVRTGSVPAGGMVTFQVTGRGGIQTGATNVVLNVTVVHPTGSGWGTAYPAGAQRPGTSNLNFMAGRTTARQLMVSPSASGQISVWLSAGANVIVDVQGYTPAGATGYRSATPTRLMDTRYGAAMGPGSTRSVSVLGHGGVPTSGVSAVVLSVVGTRSTGNGWLIAYPHGAARPNTSNLNTATGQTESTQVIIQPGTGGAVDLYAAGRTDLVVDLVGYVTAGSSYLPVAPRRLLDSRTQPYEGATDGGIDVTLPVPDGAVAAQVVVTAVGRSASRSDAGWGYYTADPQGVMTAMSRHSQPDWSTVNFAPGQISSDPAFVKIGADHQIVLDGSNIWSADVLVDLVGYVTQPTTSVVTAAPTTVPRQFVDKVVCLAGGSCAAMDRYGSVFFTGGDGAWTRTETGASSLEDLACASMTACVASNGAAMFSWDGVRWTKGTQIPLTVHMTISCPSSSWCVATTETGAYVTTDLQEWTAIAGIPTLSGPLVACRTAASCSIIDGTGIQYDFDGNGWHPVSGAPKGVAGISCADNVCTAVADDGRTWELVDGQWRAQATLSLPADGAPRLSCTSGTQCVLVDGSVTAVEAAGHWTSSPSPAPDGLGNLGCTSGACTAVSAHGDFWRYDGSAWSQVMTSLPRWVGVVDLDCPSSAFCLAGDGWGDVRTMTGTTWSAPSAIDPTEPIASATQTGCADQNHCLEVDLSRHTIWTWSPPTGWVRAAEVNWIPSYPLRCTAGVGCVVPDTVDALHRWDGSIWTNTARLGFVPVAASCPAAGSCVAIGQTGQFAMGDGRSWSRQDIGLNGYLRLDDADCASPTRCVATASGGIAFAWDGRSWRLDQIGEASRLADDGRVFCETAGKCITLNDGRIEVWDGAQWSRTSAGLVDPWDLTCSQSRCAAFNLKTVQLFSAS